MISVDVYALNNSPGILAPLRSKRDWMDSTFDNHAYRCLPINLANSFGWELSFPEDIVFIWDGISDSSPDHVKVISGQKYCSTGRANGTISFNTGLVIKTDENVTMMHMPVPNMFIDGVQAFTGLVSSSFYHKEFPASMMITKPNEEIVIKANTPVLALLPISLGNYKNVYLTVHEDLVSESEQAKNSNYIQAVASNNAEGRWSDFYRNGVDENNTVVGRHEVKSLRFNLIDKRKSK